MRILYIGGGFVGACSAAVTADSGHQVLVFDVDKEKVKKLGSRDRDAIESCLYEEGLADLLIRNHERIRFTTDMAEVGDLVDDVDGIFMCLPTPEKTDAAGETDLSYYEKAVSMIGPILAKRQKGKQTTRVVIINKSTVPIHMIDYTHDLFQKEGVKNFGIVSNPEFLVEGKAIEGSIHPDRVIVGAAEDVDFIFMRELYRRFTDSTNIKYIEVNPYEAAAGKLLANFLLFEKVVTTFDVVGRVAEQFPNISYEQVRKILSSDPRIGSWGLYNSLYAGGSCFIKDALSLAHQLEQTGTSAELVRTTLSANDFQRDRFFGRAETDANIDWAGATVAVLGIAFKQDTNDIRNSGTIGIIQQLLGAGVKEVRLYDPAALAEAKKYFDPKKTALNDRISYVSTEQDALSGTSACIICTDWPQFKTLADTITKKVKPPYLIMDGRRMIASHYAQLQAKGYDIIAVGSPFLKGKKV